MNKVNAVVVTYNRKELLEECLDALLNQTYKLNKIIVIDNASIDGTKELLKWKYAIPEVKVFTLKKNTGGAGGFYYGTKKAADDADWVWEMDDDTIPNPNALEELLKAKDTISADISFMASTVYGMNGKPMNVPRIDERPSENGYPTWFIGLKNGIVEIESATLVSVLFNANAVKKIGAPHPFFYIWGDDTEYTLRMTHCYGKAYLVGNSTVIHKRVGEKAISILNEENVNRIKMYKMLYRNNLVCTKNYYSRKNHIKLLISDSIISFKSLVKSRDHKWLRFFTVQAGIFEFFLGKYDKKAFDKRYYNIEADYLDEYLVEDK